MEFACQALRRGGEENLTAEAGAECGDGAESFQRSDYPTDENHVFQSHHDGYGGGVAGKRTVCTGPVEGNLVGGGWSTRSRDDEVECARHRLRYVHLESAQVAAGAEREWFSLRTR